MRRRFSLKAVRHAVCATLCAGGLAAGLGAAAAQAQIAVPDVQLPRPGGVVGPITDPLADRLDDLPDRTLRRVERLADARLDRIDRLVRRNTDVIERDAAGEPARRGELVVLDAAAADLARVGAAGFAVLGRESLPELELEVVRLSVPRGMTLAQAETTLAALLPGASVEADNLYFRQGAASLLAPMASGPGPAIPAAPEAVQRLVTTKVGMIDGGAQQSAGIAATRGFAAGAPVGSDHGSAVASLLLGAGIAAVDVADVYGTDRAGGSALAIARGLGWLIGRGNKVVTISLVGPRNAVMERAIANARRRGVVIVAAVGNDGPAAPPAYPASYDGVVAVTGVDRQGRALIEAGRALGLDYAAPGADIFARDRRGRRVRVRGTSYAAPLVAARVAAALERGTSWRSALDGEAEDLGARGTDDTYGRGLLCRGCGR